MDMSQSVYVTSFHFADAGQEELLYNDDQGGSEPSVRFFRGLLNGFAIVMLFYACIASIFFVW